MSVLFIVNPLSERVARKGSLLRALAPSVNADLHIIDNFEALPERVTKTAETDVKHVFIEGGDGTVQGVLTAFLQQREAFKSLPAFTLIPGGMTNQVAGQIGMKSASKKSVTARLSGAAKTRTQNTLLRVSSATHPDYFGFLFSTGAVPMITDFTKANLHRRGIGGSMAVLGGILKGISGRNPDVMWPSPLRLTGDGPTPLTVNEDHLGTLVTSLPGLILGLDPFWGREPAPIRVTYASAQTRHLYRHVMSLWLGMKGRDRTSDGLQSWNTDTLSYHYDGPVVLDGEPLRFPDGQFNITATEPITFVR